MVNSMEDPMSELPMPDQVDFFEDFSSWFDLKVLAFCYSISPFNFRLYPIKRMVCSLFFFHFFYTYTLYRFSCLPYCLQLFANYTAFGGKQ